MKAESLDVTRKEAKAQLQRLKEWAQEKIQAGGEPPWAWYQYMKLVEVADAILAGMAAVSPTASSQQSHAHQGSGLRLVDGSTQQDSAQSHPPDLAGQLPM